MTKIFTYALPALFYLLIALSGKMFTAAGLTSWYPLVIKPSYTPPGNIIGIVWTLIYALSAVSLMHFVNVAKGRPYFFHKIGIYVLNGIFNAAWSYIFFSRHLLGLAVADAALIGITLILLIILVWPDSRTSGLLLLPYLIWVCFATYLSYVIYKLN